MTEEQKNYIESEEFVEGFKCLELEVPWIVAGAIYKLDEELNESDNVIEFGVGGSTIFFAKRCNLVFGIDTNLDWLADVLGKLLKNKLFNGHCKDGISEDYICKSSMEYSNLITVLSVDMQGGINRSRILNFFLEKSHSDLRMIILDNYGHEGIFPDHYDKVLELGEGWNHFDYNHPRWAGNGTRIYIKTK